MPEAPPPPVIEQAIEPKTAADRENLARALAEMTAQDSAFSVSADPASGQTIMHGTGELHLDIKVDTLRRVYMVHANIGAPQVAYRETVCLPVEVDYTHAKVAAGSGEFARVKLAFEPGPAGSRFVFEDRTSDMSDAFVDGVRNGLTLAKAQGPLAGFPVVDFKAALVDWAYHDLDSTASAFEAAAIGAFRQLRDKHAISLLEPIMKLVVVTPGECMADLVGDLSSRRGKVQDIEPRGDELVVTAFAPMSNLFGYVGQLRAFTQGRAEHTMTYDHYAEVLPATPDPDPRFPQAMAMRA